jgi:hypothetical protein
MCRTMTRALVHAINCKGPDQDSCGPPSDMADFGPKHVVLSAADRRLPSQGLDQRAMEHVRVTSDVCLNELKAALASGRDPVGSQAVLSWDFP